MKAARALIPAAALALAACATPLMRASKQGDEARVKQLLEGNPAIDATSNNFDAHGHMSALMYASERGHLKIVQQLVEKGADVNLGNTHRSEGHFGWTPLAFAARNGHEDVVRYLLDHGAEVTDKSVAFARESGRSSIVRLLAAKERGEELPVRASHGNLDDDAYNRMRQAAGLQPEAAAARKTATPAPRPQPKDFDKDAYVALCKAARAGSLDEMTRLIREGADPNAKDPSGYPIIDCAVNNNQLEALRLLLDNGAAARAAFEQPGWGRVPGVEYARGMGYTSIVELLNAGLAPKPEAAARRQPGIAESASRGPVAPSVRAFDSDVDSPKSRGPSRPDDFALVVGIEDYQSLPKADYGARDAETVRKHLEALGLPARNIIALTGAAATGNKLKSYLDEWLPLNVKETSTLWVYYSGHGAPDPKTGQAYLVPWDGDPQFLKSTALPLKAFYAALSKTKAKHVIVALDACFSGAGGRSVLAKGARPLVTQVDQGLSADARLTVLAAASGDQITGTLDEQGHGMFTYFFLKGLGEGKTSAKALFDYLSPKVQDEARRQNREQTPALLGEDAPL